MPPPKPESAIQKDIMDYLERREVLYWRLPVQGVIRGKGVRAKSPLKGMPDLMGILPNSNGKVFFIEVKSSSGKLSDIQEVVHRKLRHHNCLVINAKELQDVRYFIDFYLKA